MAGIIQGREVSEMSAKKRYDIAFKKEIAQVYLDGQRTAPSLAEELGLHVNTIYKWAEQYKTDPENAFPGSGNMKPDEAELTKAKRRIRELEEEVDILKKAAAYFAKNSR
jgi:transposase